MKIFSNRLTVAIFCILIVGFILTSYLSYIVTKDHVHISAETQTLPLISDNIYSDIKEDLIDPMNVSSMMANDAFLINWVQNGENDLPAIEEYLGLIREEYGYTSTFFVSERTGNYYYADGILKTLSSSDAHDVWYFDFKDMNTSMDLDIDNDEAKQGLLTIFINHRLEDKEGSLLGVTGIGLELTQIAENLQRYEEQYDHQIYITDQEGLIQIHTDRELIETANIAEIKGIQEISDSILDVQDEIKILEYENNNGPKLISVRYIPEFNWFLIVEKDERTSLAEARQSLFLNIFIGLVIAVIVSLIINQLTEVFNKKIKEQAMCDDLTKLYNRRAFLDLLDKEGSAMERYGYSSALLMIDIDGFKEINDRYGHFTGDQFLVHTVEVIRACLRQSDILGRWGGDEIIAYLPYVDVDTARKVAKRIRSAVEQSSISINGRKLKRTISIGVTQYEKVDGDISKRIQIADEALLAGKKAGKNKIVVLKE